MLYTLSLFFDRSYQTQAFVAAVAVGLVCSLLSVIVVLKRMAFIGQGISHAGFGGVGTAALLGFGIAASHWTHDLIVFAFCLGTGLLIGALSRARRVETDTAIGILLAATMAWGVLAQNLRVEWNETWPAYRQFVGGAGYTPPWEAILFGSLLNVGAQGMWTALVMCSVILLLCATFYRHLVFFAFDEDVSRVFGVRTRLLHYLLMIMLAVVIVVAIRLVGLILVSGLLIVPGATALLLSRRMATVLWLSAAVGVLGSVGGLMLSFQVGSLSPGPCIVAVMTACFGVAYVVQKAGRLRAHRA